jgi:hypothetical protein
MNMPDVRSQARFFGFISTLFGAIFIVAGLLGLIFALTDLVSSHPRVESGMVLASIESPSSGHYTIRVRLDDGRQVMVAEEPSPIDNGVKLRLVVKDGAYWIYDPAGPWIGSLIALAAGIGMCLAGRKLRLAGGVSRH